MGVEVILAIVEAVGKVGSFISGIKEFVKTIDGFLSGRDLDWDPVRAVISSEIVSRNQILQVSAEILDAVAQLDRRIFLERMADKLGDSDQAVLAFDTWKRTGDSNESAIALNDSAGALSDVLRYSENNVYPKEALVFPLVEILLMRLLILKEADPDFVHSSIGRQPIQDAAALIGATADSIESAVQQANTIRENNEISTRVRVRPADEGGGRETLKVLRLSVTYRNIDGSVTFDRHGEFEPSDGDFDQIIQQARADAAAVRQRGLARDLERAQVTVLRDAAAVADRSLLVAEARWVYGKFLHREPTEIEAASFVARRQRANFDDLALTVGAYMALERDSLGALVSEVSGRQIDREAEDSLWNVAETFGKSAVLKLLLSAKNSEGELDTLETHHTNS